MKKVLLPLALLCGAAFSSLAAADPSPGTPLTAGDLAARLSELQQDGSTFIRVKLEVTPAGGAKTVLQLQIKSRRTPTQTDMVYQVLWPKERKGESVLVRSSGSGAVFIPPDSLQVLDSSKLKQPFFASDLSYEDVAENFFAWKDQSLGGTEVIGGVSCQILESKPGKGARSSYHHVLTWVDLRRMVAMRVEKYSASNQLARRIETSDVANVDGRNLPASLTIQRAGQTSSTVMDGSRIRRGVVYTDADFTPEGLKTMSAPKGGD